MMTAKALDVPYVPIPDTWRLDPEPCEAEKENRRLRARIAELEAGPQVEVAFVDDAGDVIAERGILVGLHHELHVASGGIPFTVRARNGGTRPARHTLIEFLARGHLSVRSDWKDIESAEAELIEPTLSLPSPPAFELGLSSLAASLWPSRSGGDNYPAIPMRSTTGTGGRGGA